MTQAQHSNTSSATGSSSMIRLDQAPHSDKQYLDILAWIGRRAQYGIDNPASANAKCSDILEQVRDAFKIAGVEFPTRD
jgi:hypothetical protein